MAYIVRTEQTLSDAAINTIDVPVPIGHQENDLILMFITQDGGGTNILETSGGWTLLSGSQSAAQSQRTVCYYKIASSSSETDATLTGANDEWIVHTVLMRNVNISSPINQFDRTNSANSTTPYLDSGTVTTDENYCTILQCWGFDGLHAIVPQDPNVITNLGKALNISCVQYVGYYNHNTAGATSAVRMLTEVSSEGGTCITVAVNDATPLTPKMSPDAVRSYEVIARYGGFSAQATTARGFIRHDNITWQDHTNIVPTTIDGLDIAGPAVSFTETTSQSTISNWGAHTSINQTTSGVDSTGRWVGAIHSIPSYDFTAKILSVDWNISSTTTNRFGVRGVIIYLEDNLGGWAAWTLSKRQGILAGRPYVNFISIDNTPPIDSSGTFDKSNVVKVAYLWHRITTNTSSVGIRVKNLITLDRVTFVDGSIESPATPTFISNVLLGNGCYDLTSVQGKGQALIKCGIRIGNGSRPTYFDASTTSHELPTNSDRFWQIPPLAGGGRYRIFLSDNGTVKLTSCIIATESKQEFIIETGSSPLATYDFTGASIIGYSVTNNESGVTFNSATFSGCDITLNGGSMNLCNIVNSTSALITNNPQNISNCTFTSSGTGHAIEITATGTFNLNGNEFNGYGADNTPDAVIFNNSGGAVTINISNGDTPTVLNGVGSSTVVVSGTTLTLTNLKPNTEVRVYESGTVNEVAGVENSGTTESFTITVPSVDIVVHSVQYEYLRLNNVDTSSNVSIPIQQRFDRTYENP